MKVSRRGFLYTSVAGVAVLPGYGKLFESHWLEVTDKEVPFQGKGLTQDLRVLHLSDLHVGDDSDFSLAEQAIGLGLARQPDVVFLTGDFVTRGRLPNMRQYGEVLRPLTGVAPTFASFGNHDGGAWAAMEGGVDNPDAVRRLLKSAGITPLRNDATSAELAGRQCNIVGIGDLWSSDVDPDAAFAGISNPGLPTIVLSHNPDTTEALRGYRWDLQLSGHTHGGQVVVPILGPPYVPVSDQRFIRGLVPFEDRHVHITRGIGSIMGIRFNCRPEVSMLTLKAS
jgi:predicted MPP superfamily phosphohydrolase